MAKRDYYDVLGVSRNATDVDIKKAFRRLAKEHHPDRTKNDKNAEIKFKEAQEAYGVLSDKEKRAQYDQFGSEGPGFRPPPPGSGSHHAWTSNNNEPVDIEDLGDIFEFMNARQGGGASSGGSVFDQFFRGGSGGGGGGRAQTAAAGRDVEHHVTLTFDQSVHGATLDLVITLPKGKTQQISVHIPPGVRDGQTIRVRGKGQPGRGRAPAGDLHVVCHVQPHPYFERRENDIYLAAPVTIGEATLGAKIDLPTLDGTRTVTIPPGTPSGAKLRLTGLGIANPRDNTRGDQYVVIKIAPPKTLSAEQRRLMEQFAEDDATSPRKNLWP